MKTLPQRYARAFFRAARGLPIRLTCGQDVGPRVSEKSSSYVDLVDNVTDTAPPFLPSAEPMEMLTTLRAGRRAASVGRLLCEACDH